jgi:hypothetical protein
VELAGSHPGFAGRDELLAVVREGLLAADRAVIQAFNGMGPQFLPILTRQRDRAHDHGQTDRAALFEGLIQRASTERS